MSAALTATPADAALPAGPDLRRLEHLLEREVRRLLRGAAYHPRDPERTGDEVDAANAMVMQLSGAALQSRLADELNVTSDALHRLRAAPAQFGRCGACRLPIAPERLELLPAARTCAACS